VPGYVDAEEVGLIARFIAEVDPRIPYTLLAFAPHFYMQDLPPDLNATRFGSRKPKEPPEQQVWLTCALETAICSQTTTEGMMCHRQTVRKWCTPHGVLTRIRKTISAPRAATGFHQGLKFEV